MPQQTSPFLEGKYGWNYGESGWNIGMDEDLLKYSFMFDRNIDGIVDTLPAVVNGTAYFLNTDKRIYFGVSNTWYSTPVPRWFTMILRSNGGFYQFNGTALVSVASNADLASQVAAIQVTINSLGTAAFKATEFFASQSALDVASSQANSYTDTKVSAVTKSTLGLSNVDNTADVNKPISTAQQTAINTKVNVSDLLNSTDVTKGTALIGYKGRNVYQRLSDIIDVRDYISTTIDGTTDNQAGIAAAVSAALSATGSVYWPAGTYACLASVPNFYNVTHLGPGIIKDVNSLPIESKTSSNVTLYVNSSTGDDNNIGVNSARAFKTITAAIKAIPAKAIGTWTIDIAAGAYPEALSVRKNTDPNLSILFVGKGSAGSPTVLLDGTGLGSVQGLYAENLAKIAISGMKFSNFSASGVYFQACSYATLNNVGMFANGSTSAENLRNSHGILVATGIQVDGNNSSLNGAVCYHGFMSILGSSTITKCTSAGVLYAESSGGHCDTNLISFCAQGIYALQGGFPTISGGTVSNCTNGISADQGSYIVVPTAPTFTSNTVNIAQSIQLGIGGKIKDDIGRTAIFANNDALDIITQGGGAFLAQFSTAGVKVPSSAYNGTHLIIGSYHLWVDSSGRLRIVSGVPASDTAGTIVGAQS